MNCIKRNFYTKEDFLILHDMIDVEKHNVSGITLTFNGKTKKLYIQENICWDDETIEHSIDSIIRMIAEVFKWEEFRDFVFSKKFDEVPLEIGRTDNLSLLAHWRLKIGR